MQNHKQYATFCSKNGEEKNTLYLFVYTQTVSGRVQKKLTMMNVRGKDDKKIEVGLWGGLLIFTLFYTL